MDETFYTRALYPFQDEVLKIITSIETGIFPADLARVLLSASPSDFNLIRWVSPAPDSDNFLRNLHQLGEQLILLD
ncbi:MAG: hypothetical protein RBS68_05815 [Anaerolineales bacterium]|jgi:hypothetical protein|nr:hypothetical protein [Anaerolineales bacterium]